MIHDVHAIVSKVEEPLALDRWEIRLGVEAIPDARAYCLAYPEYRTADIRLDADKLQTGDDLQEITVHELAHCHTWPLHALAEELGKALAASMPEHLQAPMRAMIDEQVRIAGETVTTDVGHAYLRLLRRAGILASPST